VRASELLKWHRTGQYDAIVGGNYLRRGDEGTQPLTEDYVDAAGYYGAKTRETFQQFGDAFGRARDAFNNAWKTNK